MCALYKSFQPAEVLGFRNLVRNLGFKYFTIRNTISRQRLIATNNISLAKPNIII